MSVIHVRRFVRALLISTVTLILINKQSFAATDLTANSASNPDSSNITTNTNMDIQSSSADGWHFLFAPYGWIPWINGNLTVKNNTLDINVTPSDIFSSKLNYAAEAHIEAGYGPVLFMVDPTLMGFSDNFTSRTVNVPVVRQVSFGPFTKTVSQTVTLGPLNGSVNSNFSLIDAGGYLRVWQTCSDNQQQASFELLGGARYLGINNSLDLSPALLPSFTVSDDVKITAPIIGGRLKYEPTQNTLLWLRGDVGGFNIDNVTDTWSAAAGFAYTIHKNIDLGIAYRVLGIDYSKGSAGMDIVIHGPEIGIAFYC